MPITVRVLIGLLALGALGLAAAGWFAGPSRDAVVIGFQTGVDPTKVAQAEGWYDKAIARATGRPVVWRKFDSGTELITALAAGDVDFANLGSSPLAVAATRQLPIRTVAIISRLGRSEALVARTAAGITRPADLIGRRIAVPFISTPHYSLLAALRHWGIDPGRVTVLNLSPPQIAAAWSRHDIDAAYVWEPALGGLKADGGQVLTGSDQVAQWGAPTFDVWVTRRDFAKSQPAAVDAFVRVTIAAQDAWRREGARWTVGSPQAREIAAITGSRVADVPALLASNDYPTAAEQASPALLGSAARGPGPGGGGLARALADTALFLQAQGKVDRVLPDYSPYIDAAAVRRAAQDQKAGPWPH